MTQTFPIKQISNVVKAISILLFLFVTIHNPILAFDYQSCVENNKTKEQCLAAMEAGENADLKDLDCSEEAYALELCNCLAGITDYCDGLSLPELQSLIAKFMELEYAQMGELLSTIDYLKDFQHPLDGEMLWRKKFCTTCTGDNLHTGIDFAGNEGDPVYAMNTGTVVYVGYNGNYGNEVIIDHGNGFFSVYGHLKEGSINVRVGQQLVGGTIIGSLGNTGASSGDHLHLEIRRSSDLDDNSKGYQPIDPGGYLSRFEVEKTKEIIEERLKGDGISSFESKLSNEELEKIGKDIIALNFTYPMEFARLSEDEKLSTTKDALENYAKGSSDTPVKTADDIRAVGYVIDDVFNVSVPEAYALLKIGENEQTDIFDLFYDMYIAENMNNFSGIDSSVGTKTDNLKLTDANRSWLDFPNKQELIEAQILKASINNEDPDFNPGFFNNSNLYNLSLSETVDMSVPQSYGPAHLKDMISIEVYDVDGFESEDLQVMKVEFNFDHSLDGSTEIEYEFAVTQNPDYSYPNLNKTKGNTGNGDMLTIKDKDEQGKVVGEKTFYPISEKGFNGIETIDFYSHYQHTWDLAFGNN